MINITHTHPFNSPLSGTTKVSRYQKGKTNLDFIEARDDEWQWHQLDHMQVCTSLQTDNHASTPPLTFFTGRMLFLSPNQQRQNTEGTRGSRVMEFKVDWLQLLRNFHHLLAVKLNFRFQNVLELARTYLRAGTRYYHHAKFNGDSTFKPLGSPK